jgi:hypothetical protein
MQGNSSVERSGNMSMKQHFFIASLRLIISRIFTNKHISQHTLTVKLFSITIKCLIIDEIIPVCFPDCKHAYQENYGGKKIQLAITSVV